MMPIQMQIITAFLVLRERAADAIRDRARRRARGADRQRDLPRRPGRGRRSGGGDHHRPTQLQRRQGARLSGEAGVVATVIVLPALLLAFWLVLQYAVAAHVRHAAQAAANDAALAAASGSGDPDVDGCATCSRDAVGSLTSGITWSRRRRRAR